MAEAINDTGPPPTNITPDAEQGWPPVPPNLGGYPRLSALFGSSPDFAMFRRFGRLNALNLLYYQAELAQLELLLDKQVELDRNAESRVRKLYSQDWVLMSTASLHEGGDGTQWELMLAVRETLDKYRKYLPSRWMAIANEPRSMLGDAAEDLANAQAKC